MENINIINGNGNATRKKIDVLLDLAIDFYGPKYEKIIMDVVNNAYFYETNPNQSANDVIKDIVGENNCRKNTISFEAFYFINPTANGLDQIIVTKPKTNDRDYHILAHELFGHAVCGKIKPIIKKKNIYQRNGISLANEKTVENDVINEGFMESIASSIIKLNKNGITDVTSKKYALAKRSADCIMEYLGKDEIIKSLVLGKGGIAKKYNYDACYNEWRKLNKCLELELEIREGCSLNSSLLDKEINKNLKCFVKRRTKVR